MGIRDQGFSALEAEGGGAAEARLRRRIDALGIIIAGAAHEFNNVVMAVQAGARMARKRADHPDEVDRIANMMDAAADRGAHLTASLLAFTRRDETPTQSFDLCASLTGVADLLDQTLGLAIEIDCPPGLSAVRGDQGEFETMLVNLAIGVRKPTARDGALRIAVTSEAQSLAGPVGPAPAPHLTMSLCVGPTEGSRETEENPNFSEALAAACSPFLLRNKGASQIEGDAASGVTVRLRLATGQGARAEPARAV